MYSLATEIVHVFLSLPFWIFLGLVALAVWAWRRPAGSTPRRWRALFVAAPIVYYVFTVPVLPTSLERWLESRYPARGATAADRHPDNVILVLTAGYLRMTVDGFDQKLGEAGWERTLAAVHLWRTIGGKVMFTGAPTPDGKDSAAAAMGRVAVELGLPPEALLVEPASLNTFENFTYSKRMLGPGRHRIWLITSALHMPRSVAAARVNGMEVVPFPVDFRADERWDWTDCVPSNSSKPAMEKTMHELLGMLSYRLKGWN
jgi:uncharacterized SAM-binding protein YcdF (DUF218 family)